MIEDRSLHSPLDGRACLITGASEGIGWGIASAYAKAGAAVMLSGRTKDTLLPRVEELQARGFQAAWAEADVVEATELAHAVASTVATFGSLDILVTSAGYSRPGAAVDVSPADAANMIDTGFLGTFLACQAAARVMKPQGYGKIVTLGSTLGSTVSPGTAVYSAVKAGIAHLTRALAVEWAEAGIRVNSLAPTAVETPSRATVLSPQLRSALLARLPLGRFAHMSDITPLAIYLAAAESDFVTGQTFHVDGGWTARG